MFWADRIADEIRDKQKPKDGKVFRIRDEKTLSGRVHVGSMRGVAIHGAVSEALSELGVENVFEFELNDFDPFDAIPSNLSEADFKEQLGKPLFTVPAPDHSAKNYAEYYGADFVSVHEKAGFRPTYYRTTELYTSGAMDAPIKTVLTRASDIRRILKEISGSEKDATWLPVSVVCEKCGKMMTTRTFDFDGETVAYACDRNAEGISSCGHTGRLSPLGGKGKLFWKADWAAKWVARGVDIEGAGKDHSTKGGARDVANHIAREVFNFEPPFDIPYEFFLVGGKKMSTSKGRGSSAREIADLFPAEIFRLTFMGKDINQAINFDPEGDTVPRLNDQYGDLAEHVREGIADDYARMYAYSQLPQNRAELNAPWNLRFSQVAFLVQQPHLSIHAEAERVKGSPLTDDEKNVLEERVTYAKFWLTTYAPPAYKYELQQEMPKVSLSDAQKKALTTLAAFLEEGEQSGEDIHKRLHELKSEIPIPPSELFSAIYQIFLARDSGPKAGWFLSVLPRDFVLKRLQEAIS